MNPRPRLRRSAALGFLVAFALSGPSGSAVAEISPSALAQIQALRVEKESRTPVQHKLDSQLVFALKQSLNQVIAPGVANLRSVAKAESDGLVLVDITATVTPDLLNFIANSGGVVVNNFPQFRAIRARLPFSLLESLAARADVEFIQTAVRAITSTGSVTSEGDVTHRAAEARQSFFVDGTGVKVGVLSDSVDYLANSQSLGDLPSDLVVLPGQSGVPASGEGTAMLEIVHDLAPGSKLYFATAFNGQASFAQNILNLRAAGCDVIIDDVFYFNESPFQDGIIARAVNTVTADGAMFFSSAGNEGSVKYGTGGTWEGDFVDGGPAGAPVNGKNGNIHSFGATNYDSVVAPGFAVALFWSDPLGASTNDYDLYVLDATGQNVVDSSTAVQNGSQDPFEIVGSPNPGERIVIVKASGDARYLHLASIRGRLAITTEGTTKGHSAATNAFSVAAVDVATAFPNPFSGGAANPVETFSSEGPRRMFYQADGTAITPGDYSATGGAVRQKPDIAAADGVVTTLPPFSGLNPFFGTSAAAPHAGAIAALVKSYNPALQADDIRSILTGTALDNEGPGVDINSGYGIVMAAQALAASPGGLILVTNYLFGGNGNGVIDVRECNDLQIVIKNNNHLDTATGVSLQLATRTPEVAFGGKAAFYPDLPPGATATNLQPLSISTGPNFICGTPIVVEVTIKSDQATITNFLNFTTGTNGPLLRFDATGPIGIPDANPLGTNSPIVVSNINSAISKVAVSLYLTHTYDSDLTLQLISPDGVTNTLSANNGGSANNYGAGCAPEFLRTTFDDAAGVGISGGAPPYVGSYKPDQPLSVFVGKSGTNVNGTWQLRMVDSVGLDVGVLQCWSLLLSAAQCVDGGGSCPGADLAVALRASPNPSFVGSNLVYTITVTNFGPNAAKGAVVNQRLPSSVLFLSAVASQGNCVFSGGSVICNLGDIPFGGTALITVTVLPTTVEIVSSTATVTSGESDPDLRNNTATINIPVNPPTSELALGLLASPNPALVGGSLSYSLAVTNSGPSTASGVLISNTLPVSINVQSAAASQGTATIYGNLVVFNLGSLTNGGRATASISGIPTAVGTVTATASVSANQADPILANNVRILPVIVGPASDLVLGVTSLPSSVVVSSNFTYAIGVTNFGPTAAESVVVNASIATGVNVLSTDTTLGTITRNGNTVTATLGPMNSGATAAITILARATNVGSYPMSANVASASADPNPGNNSAATTTVVASPNVAITNAGATLTAESLLPANGAVDNGETVTVTLRLRNAGNVNNTNLVATLLATNGVTAPSASQNYGVLAPGGLPVGRSFTFTASGANGGLINPTLQLQDGPSNLGLVAFNFALSDVHAYSNPAAITINDALASTNPAAAAPYPSPIVVSGLTGLVGRVSVTLSNFNHTYPDDVDVLLVGPNGKKVILFSDAGGGNAVVDTTITFSDGGAPSSDEGQLLASTYAPADFDPGDFFPAPAPSGPVSTALSAFNGDSANGTWSLYVVDDQPGDVGNIANGWRLAVTTVTPVNQLADLRLSASVSPNPAKVGSSVIYNYAVTNAGPDTASGIAFSDPLPGGAELVSASASQGVLTTNASSVLISLGNLAPGGTASITVTLVPGSPGLLTNSASLSASEIDLNPSDNSASPVASVVLPVADLGVFVSADPAAVIGSNVTFSVMVTNQGPEMALNVLVSDPLPAGLMFVSATGGATNAGGNVIASLGNLPAGASASFEVVATAAGLGAQTNLVTVNTGSSDPNGNNNSTSVVVTVNVPAPVLVVAGATLIYESFTPTNGTVDAGETVTVGLAVKNIGSADTTNLWGLLQPTGGVTSNSPPKNYGRLLAGGPTVTETFTFTASGTNGGVITASLLLDDQGPVGTVDYTFNLPAVLSFASTNAITIPDHGAATPYPSVINVSGLTGLVSKVSVALHGLTHGFPDDLDVLLVSPDRQKVVVMSDAGGGHALSNIDLTLLDGATPLPDSAQVNSGTYGPTDYEAGDNFPSPAPAGVVGNLLSLFNGINPNGDWSLYVVDDATGDAGLIAGGWSLVITTVQPVAPAADLALTLSSPPGPVYVGSALPFTITVTNRGPALANDVTIRDTLPPQLNFVGATSSLGTVGVTGSTVSISLGDLPAGSSAVVTLRTSPSSSGDVVNLANVSAPQLDLNPANNSAQATASIIAPALAQLVDVVFANGTLQATLEGEPNQAYVISTSSDLTTWTPMLTNTTSAGGSFKFSDSSAPSAAARFYRAVLLIP